MGIKKVLHYPRFDTLFMVEKAIFNSSGFCTKKQLWKNLPKKLMYQTFSVILEYLIYSGKILINSEKKILWIYNNEVIKNYLKKPYISKIK